MADSHVGLTNGGLTSNFDVSYDDSRTGPDGTTTDIVANANALLGVVENEFSVTTGWFGTPSGKFGTGNRQRVKLDLAPGSGANNSGYGSDINLDSQSATDDHALAAAVVGMVFMAEWSEILMSVAGNWNAGDSSGEGLSQFCSIQRFLAGHYDYYGSWVQQWLNGGSGPNAARSDWVNQTFKGSGSVHGDGDPVSFGCALAFIYYLFTQLQFTEHQVIEAYSGTLASAYHTLTGDSGDPFPAFLGLIEHVFPAGSTALLPGSVPDDPFPIAITSIWADRDTFGKDEVADMIKQNGSARFQQAFWVVVDGFSEASFNALAVTVDDSFPGSFSVLPGLKIIPNQAIDYENVTSPLAPQRIRIPFDIEFTSTDAFPGVGSAQYDLSTSLSASIAPGTGFGPDGGPSGATGAGGLVTVSGSATSAKFELLAGADPFFTNVDTTPGDPNRNNAFYLSQDLRVFTATPALNATPVPGGPAFATDSVAGAYAYVQQLIGHLNAHFSDPLGTDPFRSVLPGQASALTADSSVTPYTYDFSDILHPRALANYSFAIARVRLNGASESAANVRVFFRMWQAQSPDTDYQPSGTYLSTPDAAGQPGSPLPGAGHSTIPVFASGNNGGGSDYGPGGPNIRPISVPVTSDGTWAYFGCFLNVYDPANTIDGQPVQAYLAGTHHCLVAQIAYDEAPVIVGSSPQASDKLAQRNLQVTHSDNPGPADTHRVPQAFDTRPSALESDQSADELMIDWGQVPAGSVASIYWPQVRAADVIDLADAMYASHTLTAADFNTVQVTVTGNGVSYVPVPRASGPSFAGLLTIDLPQTVRTGQEFAVLVRRISTKSVSNIVIQTRAPAAAAPAATQSEEVVPEVVKPAPDSGPDVTTWRYVVGTFTVQIPVATAETMLVPEENTLAILRWRLQQLAPANRWYKVLDRYASLIAARVDGLGGNSTSILPSPVGVPVGQLVPVPEPRMHEYAGKVCEVCYDCFGEFEGFRLEVCGRAEAVEFRSRTPGVEDVAVRACAQGLTLDVVVKGERITRLVLRR